MLKHHEAIVHFPIALIVSTFIFGIIGLLYKRELFKEIIFWNLAIGVITAAAALYTGFEEQEQVQDQQLREILQTHERNGYFMVILLGALAVWMAFRKKSMDSLEYYAWMSIFFIAFASVGYQGYIGHEMTARKTERMIEIRAAQPKTDVMEIDYTKL